MNSYDYLLHTKTSGKWQNIGAKRRAGICVPLFSIYSSESCGIGEIPDLKLLVDWSKEAGFSIIQMLPLNDTGGDFAPYNSLSTFALDPMYLSIGNLRGADISDFKSALTKLKTRYRPRFGRVNYRIKKEKLDILWQIFNSSIDLSGLGKFTEENDYWIKDYSLYKVISETLPFSSWEFWNNSLKNRDFDSLSGIEAENPERINFHCWIQWQLSEQMKDIKHYASERGILIMGDLPYLVSRESADVWSHQNYFRLDLASGAPPDLYFALGQKWGMPPYNWDNIANNNFTYLKKKLSYAANFYHLFRIDHFIGLFRVWVCSLTGNALEGSYFPSNEDLWEIHGRRIIDELINSTPMLPCAEDLGTVPECSRRVLQEYGIPGIEFQRYMKHNFKFLDPQNYRPNSIAVLSTHDSTFFINWWKFEAGTIDEKLFESMLINMNRDKLQTDNMKHYLFDLLKSSYGRLRWKDEITTVEQFLSILKPSAEHVSNFAYLYLESFDEKRKFAEFLGYKGSYDDNNAELIELALRSVNASKSIFSIQLLHEYLCLDNNLQRKLGKFGSRINTPGKLSSRNWSQILPISLEELLVNEITVTIRNMLIETGRI